MRKALYETCSDKVLRNRRSWKDLRKLFKTFHWSLLAIMFLSLIAMIAITIAPINKWFIIIPLFVFVISMVLSEFKFESLLDSNAKNEESDQYDKAYKEYVTQIQSVLEKHGVNSKEKRVRLIDECKCILETNNSKYKIINSNVFNLLIGVPIGAFISSLNSENQEISSMLIVIALVGSLIIIITKIIKTISFYTDGYFKDLHLLDLLEEVEYNYD